MFYQPSSARAAQALQSSVGRPSARTAASRPSARTVASRPSAGGQQAHASSASGLATTATGRPRRGTARTAQQREQAQGGRSAQAVCPQTGLAIYAKTTLLYSLINPRSKPLFI